MYRFLLILPPLLLFGVPGSRASAPVAPGNGFVHVTEESAIIVWDAATKTEQLIRGATFGTRAAALSFLVPTPSRPEVTPASDEAFVQLKRLTEARTVTVEKQRPRGRRRDRAGAPLAAMASLPGVRGPEVRRVPGDQYAVLEADRVTGLNDWLKTHGYASRPELEEWFTDYLQKKWKITAFKVDKEWADQHGVSTAAVRMSFKADQPYFPYAEPA